MAADQFECVLTSLLQRQPFRPFTVELQDGKRFEVDEPYSTAVGDGVAVFLAAGARPILFGHDSVNQIIAVPASTLE